MNCSSNSYSNQSSIANFLLLLCSEPLPRKLKISDDRPPTLYAGEQRAGWQERGGALSALSEGRGLTGSPILLQPKTTTFARVSSCAQFLWKCSSIHLLKVAKNTTPVFLSSTRQARGWIGAQRCTRHLGTTTSVLHTLQPTLPIQSTRCAVQPIKWRLRMATSIRALRTIYETYSELSKGERFPARWPKRRPPIRSHQPALLQALPHFQIMHALPQLLLTLEKLLRAWLRSTKTFPGRSTCLH